MPRAPPIVSAQPVWPQPQEKRGICTVSGAPPGVASISTSADDRSVTPFACHASGTAHQPSIDCKAATDACAHDGAEGDGVALPRPLICLGKRKTVRIIGGKDRALQKGSQVLRQRSTRDAGDVCRCGNPLVRLDETRDRKGKRRAAGASAV